MCIIRFHASAGYLQIYETLLKEINSHPGSNQVPPNARSSMLEFQVVVCLVYRTTHPALRWLSTKLGENLQEELGFPDKADKRVHPGTGWTPAELNNILQAHVVNGALTTFGCME